MNTADLTLAQRMVLVQIDTTPRTAIDLRNRLNLPRTAAAKDNVNAALADLIAAGLVVRTTYLASPSTYALAAEVEGWDAGAPCPTCGGDTLAPRQGRPEEEGDYCEACGTTHERPQTTVDKAVAAHQVPAPTGRSTALSVAQADARRTSDEHQAAMEATTEARADLEAAQRLMVRARATLEAAEAHRLRTRARAVDAEAYLAKVQADQA